jgi:type I restriction enzyme S subunit
MKKNDILFQMVRPYQRNNYLFLSNKSDVVASTGYAQIRTRENFIFLYHLFHTDGFVNKVLERCTGTSYPAINSSDLAKIEINIPCPLEQQKIASFLSALDKKIKHTTREIEKMKNWKRGLLQKMFV